MLEACSDGTLVELLMEGDRVTSTIGAHPASYTMGNRGSFPEGKSGRGVKLTTHLHLVPRSRNVWIYASTHPHVFMAWCLVECVFLAWYLFKHKDLIQRFIYEQLSTNSGSNDVKFATFTQKNLASSSYT